MNDVHLWLGLASGLVLFIVCLTGTIYTFRSEVEAWFEPAKYRVAAGGHGQPLSPDSLIAGLERQLEGKVAGLEIPHKHTDPYRLTVRSAERKTGKGSPGGGRPKTYLVNPYTGAVQGTTEGVASPFFLTVMQLHRWLLIKEGGIGKMIVGVATLIFVFLVLSGLVLWWPLKLKHWKRGLKVKWGANWKRTNHDLHNTLGFYSSFPLLVMALTGLCWSFDWYREGISTLLGDQVFKQRSEKPVQLTDTTASRRVPVAALLKAAERVLPPPGNYRIALPQDVASAVVITRSNTGFFAFSGTDKVQLDPHTARVLKLEKFADKPFNQQVAALVRSLHLGDIYGGFSKLLYFVACLVATSLPVTGTLIWLNKRKKSLGKETVSKSAAIRQA